MFFGDEGLSSFDGKDDVYVELSVGVSHDKVTLRSSGAQELTGRSIDTLLWSEIGVAELSVYATFLGFRFPLLAPPADLHQHRQNVRYPHPTKLPIQSTVVARASPNSAVKLLSEIGLAELSLSGIILEFHFPLLAPSADLCQYP